GFLVLTINLRAHGFSTGYCSLSQFEPLDVMGAIDWLFARSDVNQSAIGIAGHSLGGMTVIRTAALDPRVNACVQLGAPLKIINIVDKYVKNMDYTLFQLFANLLNDLSSPTLLAETAPIMVVNASHPRNFLICYGTADFAATEEEQLSYLHNATGNSSAEASVLYGDFSQGNATKLMRYAGVDHGQEPHHPALIVDLVSWMEQALMGSSHGTLTTDDLVTWYDPVFGSEFLQIGFLLIIPPVFSYTLDYFENKRKSKQKEDEDKPLEKEHSLKSNLITILGTGGIFIGAAFAVIPLNLFIFPNLYFFRIAGLITNLFLAHALILGIILIGTIIFLRKFFNSGSFKMKTDRQTILHSLLIGVILAAFLVFGLIYLPLIPSVNYQMPKNLMITILAASLIIEEIYLRVIVFNRLFNPSSEIRNWTQFLGIATVTGTIQGTCIGIFLLPFYQSYLDASPIMISLPLLGMIGGIAIFILVGILNNYLFVRTRSVIPGAIIVASIVVLAIVVRFVPL
ncbi:MAG: alpha/beta hydrolase family protein, partial [Candidatus Helarchaeota archaeon]